MADYIEITKEDFLEIFRILQQEPTEVNHSYSKEIIYKIKSKNPNVGIVIYSSILKSTGISRGVGEDAVRVVFWHEKGNHPLGKGKRIYRVTSKESVASRLSKTIEEFLANAPQISVVDWDYIKAILTKSSRSSYGEFARSLLESINKYGRLTEGQLAYVYGSSNPKGRPTMEAKLKSEGWVYDPSYEEVQEAKEDPEPKLEESDPESVKPINPYQRELDAIPIYSDTPDMKLAPSRHPYKFPTFNPIQTLTIPFKNEDTNIVIGAATSSGKTICAELLMEETLAKKERVIYLSPLKSLTQEKYDDWKTRFPNHKITILTGDYTLSEEKKKELSTAWIVVMTSEMTDSRTRRMETEKNYWLREVGLVIVDESHIISTNRGHAVESGIMRFTSINKKARILFLSATMPNVNQLGLWLKKLNGKEVRVIYSLWRPVPLDIHYLEYPVAQDRFGRENYQAAMYNKKKMTVDIIKSKPNEKFLVFTHDKNTGRSLISILKEQGIEAEFHNADLDLDERLETEQRFTLRTGGLRILVSTSTLAWGRNLPARNVIIVGVHRGLSDVDQLDIIQMAGRAGRYGIDPAGDVYLLIPMGTTETWKEVFRNPRPVTSTLRNHQILAFHILAEIQNRVITDARSLLQWYSRSLASLQSIPFTMEDAEGILDDLEKMEMVINKGNYYTLTGLGKVSGWLYYSPYDIYSWYRNFSFLFTGKFPEKKTDTKDDLLKIFQPPPTLPIIDDLILAWALTDIPSNDWGYIPKEFHDECEDLKWRLRNRGVQATNAIHWTLAAIEILKGTELDGMLKTSARTIRFDIRRIVQALSLMDNQYGRWDKKEMWKTLPIRIQYGIPEELIELVRIPGIGGIRARKMWDKGIHSLQDVISKTDVLKTLFKPTMILELQRETRKIQLEDKKGDNNES